MPYGAIEGAGGSLGASWGLVRGGTSKMLAPSWIMDLRLDTGNG